MTDWIMLNTEADLPADIEQHIEDCLDWFDDEPRMSTEEFIDRLMKTYLSEFDLDSYDNEATRAIMKIARRLRRERLS